MPDDMNQQGADSAQQQDASGFPAPTPPVDNAPAPMPGGDVTGGVDPGMGDEQPVATPGTEVQPSPEAGAPMPGVDVPQTGTEPTPPQPGDDTLPQPQQ